MNVLQRFILILIDRLQSGRKLMTCCLQMLMTLTWKLFLCSANMTFPTQVITIKIKLMIEDKREKSLNRSVKHS